MVDEVFDPSKKILPILEGQRSILEPRDPFTIEAMEDILQTVLPYPSNCTIELIDTFQNKIDEYGRDKHKRNLEQLRKLPGIATVFSKGYSFVVVSAPEMYRKARDYFVTEKYYEVSRRCRSHFRRSNCALLKAIQDECGCVVRFDRTRPNIVILIGPGKETSSARKKLEQEISRLHSAKESPKEEAEQKRQPSVRNATRTAWTWLIFGFILSMFIVLFRFVFSVASKYVQAIFVWGKNKLTAKPPVVPENENEGLTMTGPSVHSHERTVDCLVCLWKRSDTAFVPCGHKHTCHECARKILESDAPNCPTCRTKIERLLRIFE